jgi:transposase
MERSTFSSTHLEGESMAIVTVGVDLAKNVFAVHGVDETGKPALVSRFVVW